MTGSGKKNAFLILPALLIMQFCAYSQSGRDAKIASLYGRLKEYNIECPKTVLAIIVFETGWLECKKCTYQYNNLFGFRANGDYLRFSNTDSCLAYFKIWQTTYYDPWKIKHPNGTYYDYLAHVKYAHINMAHYLRIIKAIERLVADDLKMVDESPQSVPAAIGTDEKKD